MTPHAINRAPRIVADARIPFLRGVLEPYATVEYVPAQAIAAGLIRHADALLVRTRTVCDAALLEHSAVRLIATATIGDDHIDIDYCRRRGTTVCTAAGCNAMAVMQYVVTALVAIEPRLGKKLPACTLGIVGAGHVGQWVDRAARALGMRTLRNDPPRAAREGAAGFVALDELLSQADIVTLHVPLTESTRQMADAAFFARMKTGAAFLNTSRGEVVDEDALLAARHRLSAVVLDVWAHEPHIRQELLHAADMATPHIAGYSAQGKRNATTMTVRSVARFFGIDALRRFTVPAPATEPRLDVSAGDGDWRARIAGAYAIMDDDRAFRACPQQFESLRDHYVLRNVFIE
jgi:erythronate-4-phosphate dehydrogenase